MADIGLQDVLQASLAAGPNPACRGYFTRADQIGKQAVRELQEGLRKLLTPLTSPNSSYAGGSSQLALSRVSTSQPTSPGRPAPSSSAQLPGASSSLLFEVARHVPAAFSTRQVALHLVGPITRPSKTSLLDVPGLIPKRHMAAATVYAIHAWDEPFHDVISMLQLHMSETEAAVYMDVLCGNQHLTGSYAAPLERLRAARAALRQAPEVHLCLSSPGVLSRTWVLYELWCVARERSPSQAPLQVLLHSALEGEAVRKAVTELDVRSSQATNKEDKDCIMAEVLRQTTLADFNQTVQDLLLQLLPSPQGQTTFEVPSLAGNFDLSLLLQLPSMREERTRTLQYEQSMRVLMRSKTLTASTVALFKRLDRLLRANKERLVGMLDQFDEGSKGFLTLDETAEFVKFWIEDADETDIESVKSIMQKICEGTVTPEALIVAVKHTTGHIQKPQEKPTPSVLALLKKLDRLVKGHRVRLPALFEQFSADGLGALRGEEVRELIVFWVEEAAQVDVDAVMNLVMARADETVSVELFTWVIRDMVVRLAGKR
eukprot:CAMPEP_0202919122 /NCGR_PEP_ID=MMETSP1392-20130828/75094_1 /ASSEMBLY_ACC=CAM_ASM_000868 /TAXON_ID=225041 /ORGANISM="Chlamydomonas chlamydogama, Strain SAG 11-48b" /LENGTH=544 /DNA_ID=CAMNT_0049612367 /DNA_START=116 /DNA_END=1750 /DNA_ORIENTATION=-